MTKLIALTAVGMFALTSVYAGGGKGCCSKQVANETKAACEVSFATLDLTPAQKTKMDAIKAEHEKAGCSEASEAKYMKEAKSVLNKEQYAKFEAACGHSKGAKGKTT